MIKNPGGFLKAHGKALKTRERYAPALKFLTVTFALIVLTDWLGHSFLIEPLSVWHLDTILRRKDALQERFTRLVRIDPNDHQLFFGAKSPLDAGAVFGAVCTLAKRGAAVVVVDLDTSPEAAYQGVKPAVFPVPVVWAADAQSVSVGSVSELQADSPVGGHQLPAGQSYGLARFEPGFDGLIREWHLGFRAAGRTGPTDSLPQAAVRAYCGGGEPASVCRSLAPSTAAASIQTNIRFADITLRALGHKAKDWIGVCNKETPDPQLNGRIVILGGSYSRDDRHETPWGQKDGAEIVGMAIEAAFQGPLPASNKLWKYGLKLCLAVVIAAIFHRFRPLPAAVLCVAVLPAFIFVAGEAMFLLGDLEFSVIPLVFGVMIEQYVTLAERAEHLASPYASR